MAYGLVASCVAATMLGVASWQMLVPVSAPGTTVSGSAIEGHARPGSAKISTLRVPGAPPFDTTRAPVPLRFAPRLPIASPRPPTREEAVLQEINAAPAQDLADEKAMARAAIERDGYKGVHALSLGANGLWQARALRGTTEVAVTVDQARNVSAN